MTAAMTRRGELAPEKGSAREAVSAASRLYAVERASARNQSVNLPPRAVMERASSELAAARDLQERIGAHRMQGLPTQALEAELRQRIKKLQELGK
ncbi:MAG TPA: hypothetical protein VJA40_01455 [archaeon]|nr:hypothetical protein [archaeon]